MKVCSQNSSYERFHSIVYGNIFLSIAISLTGSDSININATSTATTSLIAGFHLPIRLYDGRCVLLFKLRQTGSSLSGFHRRRPRAACTALLLEILCHLRMKVSCCCQIRKGIVKTSHFERAESEACIKVCRSTQEIERSLLQKEMTVWRQKFKYISQ